MKMQQDIISVKEFVERMFPQAMLQYVYFKQLTKIFRPYLIKYAKS